MSRAMTIQTKTGTRAPTATASLPGTDGDLIAVDRNRTSATVSMTTLATAGPRDMTIHCATASLAGTATPGGMATPARTAGLAGMVSPLGTVSLASMVSLLGTVSLASTVSLLGTVSLAITPGPTAMPTPAVTPGLAGSLSQAVTPSLAATGSRAVSTTAGTAKAGTAAAPAGALTEPELTGGPADTGTPTHTSSTAIPGPLTRAVTGSAAPAQARRRAGHSSPTRGSTTRTCPVSRAAGHSIAPIPGRSADPTLRVSARTPGMTDRAHWIRTSKVLAAADGRRGCHLPIRGQAGPAKTTRWPSPTQQGPTAMGDGGTNHHPTTGRRTRTAGSFRAVSARAMNRQAHAAARAGGRYACASAADCAAGRRSRSRSFSSR